MTQVRLDPDVAAALSDLAADGGSVAMHANRVLRQALQTGKTLEPEPIVADSPARATASAAPGRWRRARVAHR